MDRSLKVISSLIFIHCSEEDIYLQFVLQKLSRKLLIKMEYIHMKGGDEDTSYARNSTFQRNLMSKSSSKLEEAVRKVVLLCLNQKTLISSSIGVADLGCASGPNAFILLSDIIHAINKICSSDEIELLPELRLSLNDLPGNDFNSIFASLPDFYSTIKPDNGGIGGCFVSCVAGTFYGRLFPRRSLHLVHSSTSLHWLSQVPPELQNSGEHLNKGNTYISKSSAECVREAYLRQFQKDFFSFLRCRADEMVPGGQMVLSFIGRVSPDPAAPEAAQAWEILAQALITMASRGKLEEEKIDAFNAPYYAASAAEVEAVILQEGSFAADCLQEYEVRWDQGFHDDGDQSRVLMTKGQRFGRMARAVAEPMIEWSFGFGEDDMDELFQVYDNLVDDHFAGAGAAAPYFINLHLSLTRKDN
ncbi:probable jasmonic acid carboxyl methyltransferase 2 [Andrographis paniculata]|uniref:probable jasmonic acid carboxyl methyltransferase 2 n=1 Tax=Andrographis paniculata TaxID=175694 RepID=UPI0021E74584|nr:probable jasmonic acid carboxyl methyltransferase 2 [Andrographis paniculata]